MLRFLDQRYHQLPSEGLALALSDMQLSKDGEPFDPAINEEWEEAIKWVLANPRI